MVGVQESGRRTGVDPGSPAPAVGSSPQGNGAGGEESGLSRRSFLRRAGLGAATVFVVADGLLAYRAYDQGVLAEGRGPAFDAWDSWRSESGPEALVAAAILAASAHNTQPWLFAITDDRIDLYADLSRSTGANDALNRELFVSLGCALENLLVAAPARGYSATVDLLPGAPDLVASVGLRRASTTHSELYEAIGDRHSNRSEYRSDPVPVASLSAMSALADSSVAPARLVWLVEAPERSQFGALLVDATKAHVADDEQSQASFRWWRSDWDGIQRHKDGLTIDGVGLRPLVRTLGKLLPAPSRSSADSTFVDRTKIQTRSAAAFGVIVVDDPFARANQVIGGRLLERLHLWAAANDLGFQHMNQITEHIDRERQLGEPSTFAEPLEALVGPGALAAFRVGTPTIDAEASPRRPVEEVLR